MKENSGPSSLLRNRRGMLSVDFMFAMTLAAVLCMVMFAFTTSLSMLEIAEYVAFSTSRAHMAAHTDQDKQITEAKQKFEAYFDTKRFPHLAPLLRNGWFVIDQKSLDIRGGGQSTLGGADKTFNEAYGYSQDTMPQLGVRFRFNASILKMNIPLLGKISQEDECGTYVTAMLIREPTTAECKKQFESSSRFSAILNQDNRFRSVYQGGVPRAQQNSYFGLEDNGC